MSTRGTQHRWSKYNRNTFQSHTGTESQEAIGCDVCGLVFGFMTNGYDTNDSIEKLTKHYDTPAHFIQLRRHLGKPPLVCTLCNSKEYATTDQFSKHCQLRSHRIRENRANDSVISCTLCNKELADAAHRREHELSNQHMSNMRDDYTCSCCPHFKPTRNLMHYKRELLRNQREHMRNPLLLNSASEYQTK